MTPDPRVVVRPSPLCAETPQDALAAEITPAGLHYVRSNFPFPELDARTHRVRVDGAVGDPLELGMDELARLPRRTVGVTLECAGNDRLTLAPLPAGELWGGGAVASAEWGGVSLADVLARAGVAPGAREVLVEAADEGVAGGDQIRFARSLPMEKALHPDTLLAFEMNGAPVPTEHGAPLRLVVPGWYGMASVKWVARISVLTEPFAGYFQRERYVMDYGTGDRAVPVAEMAVKAVVTVPRGGEVLGAGPVTVRGWAWSGAGPVARVQVAVDGGDAWEDARVHPASAGYLWQRWAYEWASRAPGRHTLRVRAQDAAGNVQPDAPRWNRLGYGANAVRSVVVEALTRPARLLFREPGVGSSDESPLHASPHTTSPAPSPLAEPLRAPVRQARVQILLSTYNGAEFLPELLESLDAQSLQDLHRGAGG